MIFTIIWNMCYFSTIKWFTIHNVWNEKKKYKMSAMQIHYKKGTFSLSNGGLYHTAEWFFSNYYDMTHGWACKVLATHGCIAANMMNIVFSAKLPLGGHATRESTHNSSQQLFEQYWWETTVLPIARNMLKETPTLVSTLTHALQVSTQKKSAVL